MLLLTVLKSARRVAFPPLHNVFVLRFKLLSILVLTVWQSSQGVERLAG